MLECYFGSIWVEFMSLYRCSLLLLSISTMPVFHSNTFPFYMVESVYIGHLQQIIAKFSDGATQIPDQLLGWSKRFLTSTGRGASSTIRQWGHPTGEECPIAPLQVAERWKLPPVASLPVTNGQKPMKQGISGQRGGRVSTGSFGSRVSLAAITWHSRGTFFFLPPHLLV